MEKKNPHLAALQKRVEKAPSDPGVYKWLDVEGNVMYIGKAKNLKKRLQSYVSEREGAQGPWKLSLVKQIADFNVTVTRTELEALIMETTWIKEQKPKYNVLMKDDKNYVYVRITVDDDYPALTIVRKLENDKAKYFGPYLQAWSIKRTLDMLDELYHFRACKQSVEELNRNPLVAEGKRKPCLEYQIGKCNGLCVGEVSKYEYRARLEEVIRFLRGDRKSATELLRENMKLAATEKKFEKAAALRDTLTYIESLEEEQFVSDTTGANTDAIGVALSGTKAQVVVLRERGGKLIDERSFALSGEADSPLQVLEQFIPQYYAAETDIPNTILIGEETPERELMEAMLTQLKDRKVGVHVPERGKKSRLLEMAETNASEKIRQQLARFEAAAKGAEDGLKELQKHLDLPSLPQRIEGYDISHLGGTETVGSMVVMKKGKPANDQYRSFTIRTVLEGEIDDYKAMKEVLKRRLKHLAISVAVEEAQWKEKGVSVRKARKADQKVIVEIRKGLNLETEENAYKEMLVAEKEKQIVGMVRLHQRAPTVAEVRSVWVNEELRGEKLGHLLVRKILKMLKKGRAYLATEPKLEDYYADLGFRHLHAVPEEITEGIKRYKKADLLVMMYDPVKQKPDASLQTRPDLLVIDGGKGQLNTVVEVLKELQMDIPVIGLAKQEEEVFVPGEKVSRFFPKESQGKFLLMRLRDEAHRFANRHRETRKKHADIRSALDDIPGIGDATKTKLLQKFGSVQGIKDASDHDLLSVLSTTQIDALRKSLS